MLLQQIITLRVPCHRCGATVDVQVVLSSRIFGVCDPRVAAAELADLGWSCAPPAPRTWWQAFWHREAIWEAVCPAHYE